MHLPLPKSSSLPILHFSSAYDFPLVLFLMTSPNSLLQVLENRTYSSSGVSLFVSWLTPVSRKRFRLGLTKSLARESSQDGIT